MKNDDLREIVMPVSSKSQIKCKLLCYLHSQYWKKEELNENCGFYINLRKRGVIYGENMHASSFLLAHTHRLDPFLFAHKAPNEEEKHYVESLLDAGLLVNKI